MNACKTVVMFWVVTLLISVTGEEYPYGVTLTWTAGDRETLGVMADMDTAAVVSLVNEGRDADKAGIRVGDRIVSINGESAERRSNYWIISHLVKRPIEIVFRYGRKADQECPMKILRALFKRLNKGNLTAMRDILERHKCDVNTPVDGKHFTLMHRAALKGNAYALRILRFYGGDVESELDGKRPVHQAAWANHTFAVHVLLNELGASSTTQDSNGLGVAHIGASVGNIEIIKVLRWNNMDFTSKSHEGLMPSVYAERNGYTKTAESAAKFEEEEKDNNNKNEKEKEQDEL